MVAQPCQTCGKPDSPFGYGPPQWKETFWRCGEHRLEGAVQRRPIYETPDTKAAERAACARFCKRWGYTAEETEPLYGIDRKFFKDGRQAAWGEIKTRPGYTFARIRELGGYMLSFAKWANARYHMLDTQLPFVLIVVDSNDHMFWARWRADDIPAYPTVQGGRKDRDDPRDIEMCVMIPTERFRQIEDP